jgi:Peptidase family C25
VDYSGHGYEIGVSTHPPNNNKWIGYYFWNLFVATNGNKQPIIFFDACLTAKLDFTVSEFAKYILDYIIPFSSNQETNTKATGSNAQPRGETQSLFEKLLPCFCWSFIKKKYNGAIATIGATRTAFTQVDANGVHGGAGLLSVRFFAAHTTCDTAAQMLTKAQNDYINYAYKDYFTLEEFILVGDPSLKVGGY